MLAKGEIKLAGSGFKYVDYNSPSGSTKFLEDDFDSPCSIYHSHNETVTTELIRDGAYSDTIWMDTPDSIDFQFQLTMFYADPLTHWINITGSFD